MNPLSPTAVLARTLDPSGRRPTSLDPVQIIARALNWPAMPQADQARRQAATPPAPVHEAPIAPEPPADATVFWQIWLTHRDYLRRHSLRFSSGNAADAEDALSEAMIKGAQAFARTTIHNHRAWLLRLVHNACMDRYRHRRRDNQLVREALEDEHQVGASVGSRAERTPEDLLGAFQLLSELQGALSDLPTSLAEPLLLYLDEQSDADIAARLKVSKEVVRKRRQIAREWLRQRLSFSEGQTF